MPPSPALPFAISRLQESCFYPCAGRDDRPVQALWEEVRTFVFADYGRDAQEGFGDLLMGLYEEGFDLATSGSLSSEEVLGLPEWPETFHRENRPEVQRGFWDVDPWAEWIDLSDHEGRTGGILYLGTEALAAYEAVYASRAVAPRWLALLRPGCGLGGGWTDFWSDAPFLDLLEGNPAGMPKGLLCDDYRPEPLVPWLTPGRYESIALPSLGRRSLRTVRAYLWA